MRVTEQSKRNAISRYLHAKNDKEKIAAWRLNLNRILHVFNVRSVIFVWRLLTRGSPDRTCNNYTRHCF